MELKKDDVQSEMQDRVSDMAILDGINRQNDKELFKFKKVKGFKQQT